MAVTEGSKELQDHKAPDKPVSRVPSKRRDVQVARLAMLSLAAVFKDILPGYKIRPPTEKELAMVVSKDVKKLRDHESGLLRAYQASFHSIVGHCVLT